MRSLGARLTGFAFPLLCILGPQKASAEPLRGPASSWLSARPSLTASRPGPISRERALALLASVSPMAVKASLVPTSEERFPGGESVFTFEQTLEGLPVVHRGATVRFAADGTPLLATFAVDADLPASVVPVIDPDRAARNAARFSPIGARADEAHLVVWGSRLRGARLAWVVLPRVLRGLPFAPRIVVDATDGRILEARDLVTYATADVYPANPIATPSLLASELALAPVGDSLENPFLVAHNCVDMKTVKPVSFFGFRQNMHICDLVHSAIADAGDNFGYAPTDEAGSEAARSDAYSEVSIYYHAAKAYAFFRGLLGNAEAQVTSDKPLRLVANLKLPPGISSGDFSTAGDAERPLEPFSNAFFSPRSGGLGAIFEQLYGFDSGALWFGQGPARDYAYDGDVVYHEFGHAVVDKTLGLGAWTIDAWGAIDAPGAMNEGLADYFSSAITGDPKVGEYASKDLAAGQDVIRTLDNADRCPTSLVGEVHFDSSLFSGALWEARVALAEADRPTFDAALYRAMRTNPKMADLTFDELGELFLATLALDFPAGEAALRTALGARGILPTCERILELVEGPVKAPLSGLGGFIAPSTATLGTSSDVAPGIVQIKAGVPVGSGSLTVTFESRASAGSAGAAPFGGETKPYTPVVLAKFGGPITWTKARTGLAHDADAKIAVVVSSGHASATVEVPPDADTVFVQIGNEGENDGVYDAIRIEAAPRDPAADTDPPSLRVVRTGGCGCAVPVAERPSPWAVAALGAAAGVMMRRRRR